MVAGTNYSMIQWPLKVSSQTGRLQSTSGTDVAEAIVREARAHIQMHSVQGEAGSVHFDHVTPGWKVKSSSRSRVEWRSLILAYVRY